MDRPAQLALVAALVLALGGAGALAIHGPSAPAAAGAPSTASESVQLAAEPPNHPELGPEPLKGGQTSLHALGEAIVDGLARGDAQALDALIVDTHDYKTRLFALLANSPSAHQMGADLLWDMQSRESSDERDRAVRLYGRRPLRLVSITSPRAAERRGGLILHRSPVLVVEDDQGAAHELRILATVLEHEATSTFKLLAYRIRG
jgi:hypothetical protein